MHIAAYALPLPALAIQAQHQRIVAYARLALPDFDHTSKARTHIVVYAHPALPSISNTSKTRTLFITHKHSTHAYCGVYTLLLPT